MKHLFRLVVTTGPERGKVFEIDEELAHIGRAPENQIVLEDPSLSDHQASVLQKGGRFAIFRPAEADVHVDGSEIPSERWVWLPAEVRLQFGRRTSCQFSSGELFETGAADESSSDSSQSDAAGTADLENSSGVLSGSESRNGNGKGESRQSSSEASLPEAKSRLSDSLPKTKPVPAADEGASAAAKNVDPADRPPDKPSEKRKRKKKRKKQLARFITDQGNPLVELGADGQLPELALEDGPASKSKTTRKKSTSPVVLYCVLGLSLLFTLALLFIDPSPATRSQISRANARKEIMSYYGDGVDELRPYQKSLRAARLAHARGDLATERAEYRKVLDQLNSEDRDRHVGVTGHHETDKRLKQLISVIISR